MHTNTRFSWLLVVAGALALFGGCRGGIKKSPPIHVVLDMDYVNADCFARRRGPVVVPARTFLSQLL